MVYLPRSTQAFRIRPVIAEPTGVSKTCDFNSSVQAPCVYELKSSKQVYEAFGLGHWSRAYFPCTQDNCVCSVMFRVTLLYTFIMINFVKVLSHSRQKLPLHLITMNRNRQVTSFWFEVPIQWSPLFPLICSKARLLLVSFTLLLL